MSVSDVDRGIYTILLRSESDIYTTYTAPTLLFEKKKTKLS